MYEKEEEEGEEFSTHTNTCPIVDSSNRQLGSRTDAMHLLLEVVKSKEIVL